MGKLLIAALAFIHSSMAESAWESLADDDSKTTYYDASTTSLDLQAKTWRTWFMIDQKQPGTLKNLKFNSVVLQREVDCGNRFTRSIYHGFMSERMGQGNLVYESKEPTAWTQVIPNRKDTIDSILVDSLCNALKNEGQSK